MKTELLFKTELALVLLSPALLGFIVYILVMLEGLLRGNDSLRCSTRRATGELTHARRRQVRRRFCPRHLAPGQGRIDSPRWGK